MPLALTASRGLALSLLVSVAVPLVGAEAITTSRDDEGRGAVPERLVELAAEVMDRSPASIRGLLRDPAVRINDVGIPYVVEDLEIGHDHHATQPSGERADADRAAAGQAVADRPAAGRAAPSAAEVFSRHSRPGADQTIYLDFDGLVLDRPTPMWQLGAGEYDGWSLDEDPAFSAEELEAIDTAWRQTAETFAAFDVNVTTEEPPAGDLTREDPEDMRYGAWMMVTVDPTLKQGCPPGAGGCAPLGVYGRTFDDDTERGMFGLSFVPQVIRHELGHMVGLMHDGLERNGEYFEYYGGHGVWGPIMGGGAGKVLAQWSRGDYPGATNTEDDLAVMESHGLRSLTDEAGDDIATAAALPEGDAFLTRDDVDVYRLPACQETLVHASVDPWASIDLDLALLDAEGRPVVVDDESVKLHELSQRIASGATATVVESDGAARYVEVRAGSDPGDASTQDSVFPDHGYPTYGNIGRYTLRWGCDLPTLAAPAGLRIEQLATPYAVRVVWDPAPGSEIVTGYHLESTSQQDPRVLSSEETSAVVFGEGEMEVSLRAVRAGEVSEAVVVRGAPPAVPTFRLVAPEASSSDGSVELSWDRVVVDPVLSDMEWGVSVAGSSTPLPEAARRFVLDGLEEGEHRAQVCLSSLQSRGMNWYSCQHTRLVVEHGDAVGPPAALTATPAPDDPTDVVLSWDPPTDLGGQVLRHFEYSVDGRDWSGPVRRTLRLGGLAIGEHDVRVRAVTDSRRGLSARETFEVSSARAGVVRDLAAVPGEDGDRAVVSWSPPLGETEVLGYRVLVLEELPDGRTRKLEEPTVGADASPLTVTTVRPGMRVLVIVNAVDEWGVVSSGQQVRFEMPMKEPEVDPLPPVVEETSARRGRRGGAASVRLTWSVVDVAGAADATSWRIKARGIPRRGGRKSAKTLKADGVRRSIEPTLSKRYDWSFKVRAISDVGRGPWSQWTRPVRPR